MHPCVHLQLLYDYHIANDCDTHPAARCQLGSLIDRRKALPPSQSARLTERGVSELKRGGDVTSKERQEKTREDGKRWGACNTPLDEACRQGDNRWNNASMHQRAARVPAEMDLLFGCSFGLNKSV